MQIVHVKNIHPYPLASSQPKRQIIDKNSELYKASQDFESLFIKQMLDVMRKTIHRENDLLNGGLSQDVFEGMLYDEYAKKMAQTAGFGLAETIYRQVSSK
ncbi:MAG TPA: rod-binding protein [Spirochaetia bacterium]|nr:rod-binding protein [Spirochaetia bacterium]